MNELFLQDEKGREIRAYVGVDQWREREELMTTIAVDGPYEGASVELNWVQAQQLYLWLRERLAE